MTFEISFPVEENTCIKSTFCPPCDRRANYWVFTVCFQYVSQKSTRNWLISLKTFRLRCHSLITRLVRTAVLCERNSSASQSRVSFNFTERSEMYDNILLMSFESKSNVKIIYGHHTSDLGNCVSNRTFCFGFWLSQPFSLFLINFLFIMNDVSRIRKRFKYIIDRLYTAQYSSIFACQLNKKFLRCHTENSYKTATSW